MNMEALDRKYHIELESIKGAIQSSDLLSKYLEEEEEDDYQALRQAFEPQIEEVYQKVAEDNPLQLLSLEQMLLDEGFEGMYISKILGFSVLRGEVDESFRYKRPQQQFKDILLAICNSSNFDLIKKRIGQGVQLGFALSSDIWITNLVNQVVNQKVRYFLESLKQDKFRDDYERRVIYLRYRRQFQAHNFQSVVFPSTRSELNTDFSALHKFLIYRVQNQNKNDSLLPNMIGFLKNDDFKGTKEYLQLITLFIMFFDHGEHHEWLRQRFNDERSSPSFVHDYFDYVLHLLEDRVEITKAADSRILEFLDMTIKDDLTTYYKVMNVVDGKGYVHDDAIEAVRAFYDRHAGLSVVNECLRWAIFSYFEKLMSNLPVEDYAAYFEINKTFATYINIFGNQKFNQYVKKLTLVYVKKLLKKYTDKRGRDYQDIKKFVSASFLDLGFMKQKEIVELFKTRRKKKVTS
jgi:hypothetical protein